MKTINESKKMNTPQSNKKKGRNRVGGINSDSVSPLNTEPLNIQETSKFVLVRNSSILVYNFYDNFCSISVKHNISVL